MVGVLDVSHAEFGQLRLADFVSTHDIVQLVGWEYLGHDWVGEATGFTEWLRLESEPAVLRSIALALQTLPASVSAAVLSRLHLPLHLGMTVDDIVAELGSQLA
jgi:hypothetical protein